MRKIRAEGCFRRIIQVSGFYLSFTYCFVFAFLHSAKFCFCSYMKRKAVYVHTCMHGFCLCLAGVCVCVYVCMPIFILTMEVCSCAHSVPVFLCVKSCKMGLYPCVLGYWDLLYCRCGSYFPRLCSFMRSFKE